MKQTLLLITLTLSLLSCTRPTEYTAALSQVESYIEARPDSALTGALIAFRNGKE